MTVPLAVNTNRRPGFFPCLVLVLVPLSSPTVMVREHSNAKSDSYRFATGNIAERTSLRTRGEKVTR